MSLVSDKHQVLFYLKISAPSAMITRLEEKGRKKAIRYWPEACGKEMKLENGITVRLLTDRPVRNKPGLTKRFIKLSLDGKREYSCKLLVKEGLKNVGEMKTLDHLHCEGWTDSEVLRDTKVLLDLHDEVEYNRVKMPGTSVMVHCSAGVGRTGTFIGLFKLIRDYKNRKVSFIGRWAFYVFTTNRDPRSSSWIRLRPWWQ